MNAIARITPAQCRAARGLINWTQDKLAYEATVGVGTVSNFETSRNVLTTKSVAAITRALHEREVRFVERGIEIRAATLTAIRAALEAAGVEFIAENGGGPGVRLRKAAAGG